MKIYNTMTREKEEFVPINEGKANIYVWGDPADRIQDPPRARPVESPHSQLPDESSLQIVLGHDRLNNFIPLY